MSVMFWRLVVFTFVMSVCLLDKPADAQRRIRVEVVDISGGRAFVTPGSDGGLRRGARVRFGRTSFDVVGATRQYAAIELGDNQLRVGATGAAQRRRNSEDGEEDAATRLDEPTPLSEFEGQWRQAALPSEDQDPDPVPLGMINRTQAVDVRLSAGVFGIVPLSDNARSAFRGQVRARVRAEPFSELPLRLDADAAVQFWAAEGLTQRAGSDAQPILRVRELALSYGGDGEFFASLGRLRYAASALGMLDGLRLTTPEYSGFSVGAFGGIIPNPIDQVPSFDATRFGLEAVYRNREADLRPSISLTGYGSYFDGAIDERRIHLSGSVYPGSSRIGAHAEVSLFDDDNAFGAEPIELTSVGADASVRLGMFQVGARGGMRRPDRSRWLASHLPASYLCGALVANAAEPSCDDRFEPRYHGAADAGITLEHFAATVGGNLAHWGQNDFVDHVGAFVTLRALRIFGIARGDLTLHTSDSTTFTMHSVRLGLGAELVPSVLDVGVHYRPALGIYEADRDQFVEHNVGGEVWVQPVRGLAFELRADAVTGQDFDALRLSLQAVWKPL